MRLITNLYYMLQKQKSKGLAMKCSKVSKKPRVFEITPSFTKTEVKDYKIIASHEPETGVIACR